MDSNKLQQIIDTKNERREREVVRTAEDLIESIITEQRTIEASKERIDKMRAELKALEVTPLNHEAILGS